MAALRQQTAPTATRSAAPPTPPTPSPAGRRLHDRGRRSPPATPPARTGTRNPTDPSPPSTSPPLEQPAADDQRHRRSTGRTLTATPGNWTGSPGTDVHVSVAALRHQRRQLQPDQRRHLLHLHPRTSDVGSTIVVAGHRQQQRRHGRPHVSPTDRRRAPAAARRRIARRRRSAAPPVDGQTLTASPGSWTGSPGTDVHLSVAALRHQRRQLPTRSSAPPPPPTPSPADVGSTIVVAVTASNSAGTATAPSASTATVGSRPSPPANSSPPTISGTAATGKH